jgi:DNA-binding transcriptional ArsR family regulator
MIDFDTAQVLADPTARAAFKHIAKARHIRLGDLTERIHESQSTIEQHLHELEREGLVAHKRSALPSLKTYYITSDGLRAKREAGIH